MQYYILVASAALAMLQMATARNLGSDVLGSPRSDCGASADVCVVFDGTDDECHKLELDWHNLGDLDFQVKDEVCAFYRDPGCRRVAYTVNYPGYRHIEDDHHFVGLTRSIKCAIRHD
ncbi:hypothetical protein VHEMI07699 [[Torrubiella] hemipterigena]|uniref:Uncharacterized protein n=1 Tax=[Torrubiella] hemipterigena TaxID=1531966 RepID=A0A0A1TB60_9HYPO|nr:hypothetical protein VHEMI07699 [[Torrubiella] hemipterigena]